MAKKLKIKLVEVFDDSLQVVATVKVGKKEVKVTVRDDRQSTLSKKKFYDKVVGLLEKHGKDAVAAYDHGSWVGCYINKSSKAKPSKTFS